MNLNDLDWDYIISLLSGGLGVFILKIINDLLRVKRGDGKTVAVEWRQAAGQTAGRIVNQEARIARMDRIVSEQSIYIMRLEQYMSDSGLILSEQLKRSKPHIDGDTLL